MEYRYVQLGLGLYLAHTTACTALAVAYFESRIAIYLYPVAYCHSLVAYRLPVTHCPAYCQYLLTGLSLPAAATNGLSEYPVTLFVTGRRTKQVKSQLWSLCFFCLSLFYGHFQAYA